MQFHKMNVNDLRAYASDTGIRLPGRLTKKDDIIKFIVKTLEDPLFTEKLKQRRGIHI